MGGLGGGFPSAPLQQEQSVHLTGKCCTSLTHHPRKATRPLPDGLINLYYNLPACSVGKSASDKKVDDKEWAKNLGGGGGGGFKNGTRLSTQLKPKPQCTGKDSTTPRLITSTTKTKNNENQVHCKGIKLPGKSAHPCTLAQTTSTYPLHTPTRAHASY